MTDPARLMQREDIVSSAPARDAASEADSDSRVISARATRRRHGTTSDTGAPPPFGKHDSQGDLRLFRGGAVADCSRVGLIHQCHRRDCRAQTRAGAGKCRSPQTHTHTREGERRRPSFLLSSFDCLLFAGLAEIRGHKNYMMASALVELERVLNLKAELMRSYPLSSYLALISPLKLRNSLLY